MSYQKYFTLSFDDGLEQDKKLISLMKKYEIKGTFNLNSGMFGEKAQIGRLGDLGMTIIHEHQNLKRKVFKNHDMNRIPKDEIRQVYEGFEVATHGYRHEKLPSLKEGAIADSISHDKNMLSQIVGYPVVGHAYPYGASSEIVEKILKNEGIIYGREAWASKGFSVPENFLRYRPTCHWQSKHVFDLMDQFIQATPTQIDLLFMMWGHSYELDFNTKNSNIGKMERILQIISGKKDIEYCTNKEVFEKITRSMKNGNNGR